MIWKKTISIAELNKSCQGSAVSHLGIEFCTYDENSLTAQLTVDERTRQPFSLLHGGVSAALAETVGSAGAFFSCEDNQLPVGTELNISHLKGVKQGGKVKAVATPLHLGRSSQVWQVDIYNEQQQLCAAARLSVRLLDKAKE